ncbi:hypothetical protein EJ07DRAFT_173284 [Lizonia empirigonia]|nr:hypothetical protein EJ07DRAFT_173284 [Lizonia empirigonia]
MALSPAEEQSFDRLHSWLDASTDLPTPNSQADSLRPLKRARDSSVDEMNDGQSTRSHSPSKRQRREEHSSCGRSASRPASIVPSERTTFTATSSAKRTASPSRYLTELRMAEPSVSLAPITMPPQPLSDDAMIHLGQLRRRLGDALKGKYIPGGLKDAIEQDSDFSLSLSMEPIEEEAFDYSDKRTLDDFALVNILQQVKRIYQSAALCAQFGRDENAWCFGVIWPLIELATTIHGKNQWQTESVQSQSINPQYLSRISSSSSSKDRCLTRKTDFCFSYSYLNPHFCELYKQLEAAKAMPVSHTTDNFTSRTFLFSGIEVKPENGDLKEAQVQMCVWMAASLRKKIELAKSFHTSTSEQTIQGE